jgi:hypothetical protein
MLSLHYEGLFNSNIILMSSVLGKTAPVFSCLLPFHQNPIIVSPPLRCVVGPACVTQIITTLVLSFGFTSALAFLTMLRLIFVSVVDGSISVH